ncbi:Aminopeptidase O [Cricetulus griseus]|uniref:Aminopeptidase O n=1 Tax=Cricetulus griseus TaxID=10029 RepID=G3IH82_CRIGR|nr:Aminopeptidase O [Cricetulus griseus]
MSGGRAGYALAYILYHVAVRGREVGTLWAHTQNQSGSSDPQKQLSPDQIILLLECLLEQKTLSPQTLQRLQQTYGLQEQDAEVRHRWCELVVKHKYAKAYEQVERFLQEDQAMGVYLYGELMLSEDARQQQLARRCFERIRGYFLSAVREQMQLVALWKQKKPATFEDAHQPFNYGRR